ncbi:hypothetical protein [Arthrobacter mangrovi]|uniref:Uncharacterized protein n=1 Tax=Arthrobacter mangrovi TaxID=2966350 RepID=A0ABQ5MXP5_9MICC|nr:hypothetical protein [Arthrobacter mangrovi]GLB68761.1 hypothetical protein AHIS1636_32030 [Arthrobacter mangrovi]
MTDSTGSAFDSAVLRPGDRIDVHRSGYVPRSGYVEDTMPQLNIVWIREVRTGERRMISTDECLIFRYEI